MRDCALRGKENFIDTSVFFVCLFLVQETRKKKLLVKYPPLERNNVTFSAAFFCKQAVIRSRLTAGLAKMVGLGMKGCERGERAG